MAAGAAPGRMRLTVDTAMASRTLMLQSPPEPPPQTQTQMFRFSPDSIAAAADAAGDPHRGESSPADEV